MLKETEVALTGITVSSNGGTSKHRSKEDDDDEDDEDEEEEGGVHDDSDEWSEEGDNLLKVCNNKNIKLYYCFYYRLMIFYYGIYVLCTRWTIMVETW